MGNGGRGFDDSPDIRRGMRAKCEWCQHLYFQTEETTERHCEVCSKEELPPGRIHGVRERRHQPYYDSLVKTRDQVPLPEALQDLDDARFPLSVTTERAMALLGGEF